MKRILLLLSLLCVGLLVNAQTYRVDLNATITDDIKPFKKGDILNISKLVHNVVVNDMGTPKDEYSIIVENDTIPINEKLAERLDFKYKNIQSLWDAKIIQNVLPGLEKKGIQKSLRLDMEEEALDYNRNVQEYGIAFNDPYLENYIYGLVSKIAPSTLVDCRPGNVNILILDNPTMNACM